MGLCCQGIVSTEYLAKFGQALAPFHGVPEMFDRLQQRAYELNPKVEVEFYLITCGMVEVAHHNCIAPNFKAMWGCEFHYGTDGGIEFTGGMGAGVKHDPKSAGCKPGTC
jgi:hypothetical protein